MSLFGMMRTSVSGMNAQANRLSTVADNIANAGTVGYKRSGIQFSTQVLDLYGGNYNSGSVNTNIRYEIGRQGAMRATSSATDIAINGTGLFIVEDNAGETYLTRAGSFFVDSAGNLVNAQGNMLMGYDVTASGSPPVANGFGGLSQINIGSAELLATATTLGELIPNLPANADVITAGSLPSDNVVSSEFTGKSSLIVFDSLGNEQLLDVYFAKTGANSWEAVVYNAADSTNGSFPYTAAALAQTSLTFDPSTGGILGGGSTTLSVPVPGGVTMDLDMTGVTQLGSEYTILSAETNGNSPASVDRVEIDRDGRVYGIFNNGFARPLFQIALAKVPSPDNLRPLPGNVYSVTVESGNVLVGVGNSDGFGQIQSGVLEESNVDMASELTIMIESQRSYTANSKVFQTGSDLMDVLLSLKR